MLAPVVKETTEFLGDIVYGVDVTSLEAVCMAHLKEKGWTFATAESCTGGQIAARITALPGASNVYRGGVVSYWTDVKAGVLGVPRELLDTYGAVSEPCARSMAEKCPPDHRRRHWLVRYRRGRAGCRRTGQPRGAGLCGTGFAGGNVLPEAGTGKSPPRPDSGSLRQPCLRYAASLPHRPAGGTGRPWQAFGKDVNA